MLGELDHAAGGCGCEVTECGHAGESILLLEPGFVACEPPDVPLLRAHEVGERCLDRAVCSCRGQLQLLCRQSRAHVEQVQVGPTVIAEGFHTQRAEHPPILALLSCQGMRLDTLQARGRSLALYERYGALLTDHQQAILDLYLRSDWSLAEIANHEGTSRAAVHDIVKRSTHSMQEYERRLGLLTEAVRRKRAIEALEKELEGLQRRMARLSV